MMGATLIPPVIAPVRLVGYNIRSEMVGQIRVEVTQDGHPVLAGLSFTWSIQEGGGFR